MGRQSKSRYCACLPSTENVSRVKPAAIIPQTFNEAYSRARFRYDNAVRYEWHDFVGNVGVAIIIGTYLLLQLDRLPAGGLAYSLLNAAGAAMVVVSLLYDFNVSAMVVEVFWVLISLVGVARYAARRRRA